MAVITTKPMHTLTSHILHSIHRQGISLYSLNHYGNYQHLKHYYHKHYQYQSQQFQVTVLTQ